ncbi:FAD-binding oxidoreductase [Marinomonas epiphytica]
MDLPGWGKNTSPYHQGEQDLQSRLGLKDKQERIAMRIHRPYMPAQHRSFFEQLATLFVGSVDKNGWPWASIVFGEPGFISTPNEKQMTVASTLLPGDPLQSNLAEGAPLGLVGIDLSNRRRNRMNGIVSELNAGGFTVDVVQSYGNCPQYIQTRVIDKAPESEVANQPEKQAFKQLDPALSQWIQTADTFFVASNNPNDDANDTGGVDISHRGGKPGFVKVDGNRLLIPDYMGNFFFNTLGNFLVNPKAGLLFVDFKTGNLLYMTGHTQIHWEKDELLNAFQGAERAWSFTLDHGFVLKNALPYRWAFDSFSPNTLLSGDWSSAQEKLSNQQKRQQWMPYLVTRVEQESQDIRSFYLKPTFSDSLFDFKAGQHLTVRTRLQSGKSLVRSYTLSSSPLESEYRISVKADPSKGHEESVSHFLHRHLKVGDQIEARSPNGHFFISTEEKRPAVLVAGGVGVTPMISMAKTLYAESVRTRHLRSTTVIHGARSIAERAFANEFQTLAAQTQGAIRYISVLSRPTIADQKEGDYDIAGRIDADVFQALLPIADYDFYLCGAPAFMQAVYDSLISLGVNDERIFSESFGPSRLIRQVNSKVETDSKANMAEKAIVEFTDSQFEQAWSNTDGSLLEFAESHGLEPNQGCRSGSCGQCSVTIEQGEVAYSTPPAFLPEEGQILVCCAYPKKGSERLKVKL